MTQTCSPLHRGTTPAHYICDCIAVPLLIHSISSRCTPRLLPVFCSCKCVSVTVSGHVSFQTYRYCLEGPRKPFRTSASSCFPFTFSYLSSQPWFWKSAGDVLASSLSLFLFPTLPPSSFLFPSPPFSSTSPLCLFLCGDLLMCPLCVHLTTVSSE